MSVTQSVVGSPGHPPNHASLAQGQLRPELTSNQVVGVVVVVVDAGTAAVPQTT